MTGGFGQIVADFNMGSGYRFDPDGAQEVINDMQAVLDEELYLAKDHAQALINIRKPGDETASEGYVGLANGCGQAYLNFLDKAISYLEDYIENLENTRKAYVEQEDNAAESVAGK